MKNKDIKQVDDLEEEFNNPSHPTNVLLEIKKLY